MPEVQWSTRQNSDFGDHHQVGISAHRAISTGGQIAEIVALATVSGLVSPTFELPSPVAE